MFLKPSFGRWFDTIANAFDQLADMSTSRTDLVGAGLHGHMHACGGQTAHVVLSSAKRSQPSANRLVALPRMRVTRAGRSAVVARRFLIRKFLDWILMSTPQCSHVSTSRCGEIYVFGGSFDPDDEARSYLQPLRQVSHTLALESDCEASVHTPVITKNVAEEDDAHFSDASSQPIGVAKEDDAHFSSASSQPIGVVKEDDAHFSDARSQPIGVVEEEDAHFSEDNSQCIEATKLARIVSSSAGRVLGEVW